MKSILRVLALVALAISILWIVTFARDLGAREARQKIAQAVGLDKPDNVHIKAISAGMGGEAEVEAQFDAAFRFTQDKQGNDRRPAHRRNRVGSLSPGARLLRFRRHRRRASRQPRASVPGFDHTA